MSVERDIAEPMLPTSEHATQRLLKDPEEPSSAHRPNHHHQHSNLPDHIVPPVSPRIQQETMRQMFVDPDNPLQLKVVKKGWKFDLSVYTSSPFHTLLHMPVLRFWTVFFFSYIIFYATFALMYLVTATNLVGLSGDEQCVIGIERFSHAFYFSVQTSSTIGYGGDLTPDPDCFMVNFVVTVQTIVSLMLDYSMLGIVYSRFSSPTLRTRSIRFSQSLFMHMVDDHLMLSIRVGNVRSKTILNPSAKLLLVIELEDCENDEIDGKPLVLVDLHAQMSSEAEACLALGIPATISHIIDEDSPLANLSISKMAERHMEIIAMLDATDSMTSQSIEARHSYQASDIVLNGHKDVVHRRADGRLVVDFSSFCGRAIGDSDLEDATLRGPSRSSSAGFMDSPGVAQALVRRATGDFESADPGAGVPDAPPSMSESVGLLPGGPGVRRTATPEPPTDMVHVALPAVEVGRHEGGALDSHRSGSSFHSESFLAIRQQLTSGTTPRRRVGPGGIPSPMYGGPRRTASAATPPQHQASNLSHESSAVDQQAASRSTRLPSGTMSPGLRTPERLRRGGPEMESRWREKARALAAAIIQDPGAGDTAKLQASLVLGNVGE